MICLDTASGTMCQVAIYRENYARSIDPFRYFGRGNSNHTAMPTLSSDHRHMRCRLALISQFSNRKIDDLLLHRLTLFVPSVKMHCQPSGLISIASVE